MFFSFSEVFTTGKSLKARPSKIIAGAEADRTNEFLQMLGLAILKKVQDYFTHTSHTMLYSMFKHDFFTHCY